MHRIIQQELKKRARPIRVAVVGSGWFGSGMVMELLRLEGFEPKVVVDKHIERAMKCLEDNGVDKSHIKFVNTDDDLYKSLETEKGEYIVSDNYHVLNGLHNIDIVLEATGDILAGAQLALYAINNGIHFVTAGAELDSTVGLILAHKAKSNGVIYSFADGDQPGCLARMVDEIKFWGFEPKVVGNSKGFLDKYQDPTGVKPFVPDHQNIKKVCGFADGTKQAFEMCTIANAYGFKTAKRGMHGISTTKDTLVEDFDSIYDFESMQGTYVDFALGLKDVNEGAGIFVIASRTGDKVVPDLKYLKKGDGPNYLFFRDHHLCYFESAYTLAKMVLFADSTVAPRGRHLDVLTHAKRDLVVGQTLDGIGGFDFYGQVDSARIIAEQRLLPVGLAEFATLKQSVARDAVITYDMIDMVDNILVSLRREQDGMPLPQESVKLVSEKITL